MIRKKLFVVLLASLAWMPGLPVAESQEIRLEPPQLDRQGMVQHARPAGMTGRAIRAMSPRNVASRMGVSRVARQEPIRMARPRGIFRLAAFQQDGAQGGNAQNNAAQNNAPQNNLPQGNSVIQDPIIQDDIILDDGMLIEEGAVIEGVPYAPYPSFQIVSFADMEYTVGVQGFTGVPNLGESGSFGFNEGINWGFPMPVLPMLGLSGQIGVRFTQSNFHGANMTTENRNQTFFTTGISRRVDYGFQMGVVFDYLSDDWYYEGSFAQVRSEFAWVGEFGNEVGFRYISGVQDSSDEVAAGLRSVGFTGIMDFDPINTYRFYYRQQWDQVRGGHAELMGGFTENGDGMLGGEFLIPIAERWALTSDVTALFPNSSSPIDESWNIGMNLTWYPKGLTTWSQLYHRPLFDTADNGTFMFQPK